MGLKNLFAPLVAVRAQPSVVAPEAPLCEVYTMTLRSDFFYDTEPRHRDGMFEGGTSVEVPDVFSFEGEWGDHLDLGLLAGTRL